VIVVFYFFLLICDCVVPFLNDDDVDYISSELLDNVVSLFHIGSTWHFVIKFVAQLCMTHPRVARLEFYVFVIC